MATRAVSFHAWAGVISLGILATACGPSGRRILVALESVHDGGSGATRDDGSVTPPVVDPNMARPVEMDAAAPDASPVSVDSAADEARTTTPPPDVMPPLPPLADRLLGLTAACAMALSKPFALDTKKDDPDTLANRTAAICGLKGAVYWVADMDIDCDGEATGPCDGDPDTFAHNDNGDPLTPAETPYVVIPGSFSHAGLKAGAVVAVIDNATKKMTFAVFGDISDADAIGAGSYACAKAIGIDPDPKTGGVTGHAVTYIAFVGSNTVPDDIESTKKVSALGETLSARLLTDNP